MRPVVVVGLALLLTASIRTSSLAQSSQAAIEGVVRRADTGEPLAGAQLRLGLVTPGLTSILAATAGATPVPGVLPTTTDKEGKFAFRNLSPGSYRIFATANGYAPRSYGQQTSNGPATPLSVGADETLKDATIELMPAGTISGRVLDENGNPATGAPVQVYRTILGAYQVIGSAVVDDRGFYRIFWIMPGRYYLTVGTEGISIPTRSPDRLNPTPPTAGSSAATPSYEFQFFPGVTAIDQAIPIDLPAGSELSIDMKTRLQQTYRVRGTVRNLEGQPPARVDLKVSYKRFQGGTVNLPLARRYDPLTGDFEFEAFPSGSFVLQAQTQMFDDATRAAGEAAWSMFPTARVPIEVKDADLDGVVMIQTRPVAIPGQVRFEDVAAVALSSATLHLTPPPDRWDWLPPTAFIEDNGAFRVDGLIEGEYSLRFDGYPQGFYVKSMTYAGTDILNQPWQFSGAASGTIEVVLGRGAAQLSGVVRNAESQPVSGGNVVLLPEKRHRTDLYRLAVADQNGRFTFANIVPGTYKIFSWESMELGAYMDPKFIEPFEQEGRSIRLPESSTATVDVRVISNGNR